MNAEAERMGQARNIKRWLEFLPINLNSGFAWNASR
jgi:hypothetical protein